MNLLRRTLIFGAHVAAVSLLNLSSLRALVELSRHDASASHLILIPFVSVALIYRERESIFSTIRTDVRGGASAMVVGVLLLVTAGFFRPFADPAGSLTLTIAAVLVLWLAGFLAIYGRDTARKALFPLFFLVFMIPIPGAWLNSVVNILKRGSTEAVAVLFTLTGTPHHRQEYVFSLPNFVIEVADECSGIRSTIALLLTGLLAGHVFLRGAWTKVVIILAIVPITILKNGIRIVSLSLLAMHVDPGFLTGQLHHEGGIVFFLLALLILLPVFGALRRLDLRSKTGPVLET
jgi:exosortase